MYNDNTNSNFSLRNVIIQFLFVALFIFILMWLFPLKSDLNEALEECGNSECTILYDRIFNENVLNMKDAAKDYFTTERLPKNVNDSVKITLGKMLDEKIILPFTDKNGDSCDLEASYVEVTKKDNEYIMKVNLKCGEQENYLLVYMGCYDYCSTLICEKTKSDVKTPVIYSPQTNKPITNNKVNNVTNNTNNNENKTPDIDIDIDIDIDNSNKNDNNTETPITPTPTPQPEEKEYLYEYVKETDGYYKESDWSEYSETPVSASSTTSVRTKTVQKRKLVGYNVTTSYDKTKPIYANKVVTTGTEEIRVCDEYGYVTAGTSTGSEWIYQGLVTLYSAPTSTNSVKYEFVRFADESCSENCSSSVGMIFRKYTKSSTSTSKYTCTKSSIKTITLTTTVKTITGYEKKVTKEPVYNYSTVKMYSYKTRTYINGTKDIKWSVKNDTTLLNSGYSYTGNYKEK